MHQSGALLIEPSSADGYDHMLRRVAARTSPSGAFRPPPVDPNAAAAAPGEAASCQAPTPPGEANGGAAADDRQPGAAPLSVAKGCCRSWSAAGQLYQTRGTAYDKEESIFMCTSPFTLFSRARTRAAKYYAVEA